MKTRSLFLFSIFLLLLLTPMANAQGFPCVVRGIVTVNGVPTQGVHVAASADSTDTTNSSGGYGVDVMSGANATITATYAGVSQSITVSAPAKGGFLDGQNIDIVYTPSATPSDPWYKRYATPLTGAIAAVGIAAIALVGYLVFIRK